MLEVMHLLNRISSCCLCDVRQLGRASTHCCLGEKGNMFKEGFKKLSVEQTTAGTAD